MNRIRISVLICYYRESLWNLVNEASKIKDAYTDGRISYRRAWKKLDFFLKVAWQRVRLCLALGQMLGIVPKGITEAKKEIEYLTNWIDD